MSRRSHSDATGWNVWKLVEADDGDLTAEDLLLLSVLLADVIRRTERRSHSATRERLLWERLQPVVRAAQGWTRAADAPAHTGAAQSE